MTSVGERIREVRKQQGMTQVALSKATGINDSTIRKYESGKLLPKPATIERIAKGLGVAPSLLSGSIGSPLEAMDMLFGIFQEYGGTLKLAKDIVEEVSADSHRNYDAYIAFDDLAPFISEWCYRYRDYLTQLKFAKSLSPEMASYRIETAKFDFAKWMLQFPDVEEYADFDDLLWPKSMRELREFINDYPENEQSGKLSQSDRKILFERLKGIYKDLEESLGLSSDDD